MGDQVTDELMNFRAGGYRLRLLVSDDVNPLFEKLASRPEITRYLPFRTLTSYEEAAEFIAHLVALERSGNYIMVLTDDSDDFLGLFGVTPSGHQVAVWQALTNDRRARGIGRKFGRNFCLWLLAHPGVYRVWAFCDMSNKAAIAMNVKCGATFEGVAKSYCVHPNIQDKPRDCLIWSYSR